MADRQQEVRPVFVLSHLITLLGSNTCSILLLAYCMAFFSQGATYLQVYQDVWSQNGGIWVLFRPLGSGTVFTYMGMFLQG